MKPTFVLLILISGWVAGCNRPSPAPQTAKAQVVAQPAEPSPRSAPMDEQRSIPEQTKPSATNAPTTLTDSPGQSPTSRVMLLTDSGPLLIDLHTTRGEVPIQIAFENAISEIMQIATGGESKPVTWKSLLAHPRFRDGQFGNPATGNYQAQAEMIRQYDTTQNGRVDRNELIRYLTNNQTSQAVSFLTTAERRSESRVASPLLLCLDQNGNRRLDAEELESAGDRLQLRDVDDDGLLTPGELNDAPPNNNAFSSRARRRQVFSPKTGWLFEFGEDNYPWSDIRVAWETLYAAGQTIRREDLAIGARHFDAMDLDRNGSLDNIEMEMLTEIEPDLELRMDFDAVPAQVELLASRFAPESIRALIQHQSHRITLRLPAFTLDLFGISMTTATELQLQNQAQAFVQRADADNDGSLTEEEFAATDAAPLGLPFMAFDEDHDDLVSLAEIDKVLGQRGMVDRHRLQIRADSQSDALFPTLDSNADGRLDAREIADAGTALQGLDRNGDGRVNLHEFGGALMIGVVLGNNVSQPNAPEESLNPPAVVRSTSEAIPNWFKGMDRNSDQSISWREFVGTRQQFQQLDQDADGFVDAAEATVLPSQPPAG